MLTISLLATHTGSNYRPFSNLKPEFVIPNAAWSFGQDMERLLKRLYLANVAHNAERFWILSSLVGHSEQFPNFYLIRSNLSPALQQLRVSLQDGILLYHLR